MFARVTTFMDVQDLDSGVVLARERIVPRLKQQHGFAGILLIAERTAGIALAISLWKNEKDLADSEEEERQLIEGAAQSFDTVSDTRNGEVVLSRFAEAPGYEVA